jgi:hypothetical protein
MRTNYRIDHSDHPVADAAPWRRTIVEDGFGVIDPYRVGGRIVQNGVEGEEAREEAWVMAHKLIGNARIFPLCARNRVVWWKELKFDEIADICCYDLRLRAVNTIHCRWV